MRLLAGYHHIQLAEQEHASIFVKINKLFLNNPVGGASYYAAFSTKFEIQFLLERHKMF